MRTSVTDTIWLASVSSCTSPRVNMSDRAWRTCSPTRSRRTDRPSSSWLWRIAPIHHSVVTPAKAGMPISKRPRAFLDLERLDHVADLDVVRVLKPDAAFQTRSEEHTSELQSIMRISYAVLCLKKQKYLHAISNHHRMLSVI